MRNIHFILPVAAVLTLGCAQNKVMKPEELNSPPQHLTTESAPASLSAAMAETRAVAERSLGTLAGLAENGQYKTLGFASAAEARSARLAEPVGVIVVRLDQLKEFKRGGNVTPLLSSTSPRVVYPVQVDNQIRSSITVSRSKERWEASAFGTDPILKLLQQREMRRSSVVVTVPALGVAMAAQGTNEAMKVTSLQDYPAYGLKAGETLSIAEALERLADAARRSNGLPI